MAVLNAKNGVVLWQFEDLAKQKALVMDVYAPTFIVDIDDDGIPDILTAHTAQKGNLFKCLIKFIYVFYQSICIYKFIISI